MNQNQLAQFGADNQTNLANAAAANQSSQYNTSQANAQALAQAGFNQAANSQNANATNANQLAQAGYDNQAAQQNAAAQNAQLQSVFNATANANAATAAATNNANAANAANQTNFDLAQAGGQANIQSNQYDVLANLTDISTNTLSEAEGVEAENQAVMDLGDMSSDRRLKKDIKLIGLSKMGLKIYSFEYKNSKYGKGIYQGVMSDEVPPEAVSKDLDGFDKVHYNKLDVEFKLITN